MVVALGLGAGGVSFLVEPVEVWIVIRDPFFAKATNGRPFLVDVTNRRAGGADQVRRSLLRAKAFPDAVLR